MMGQALPAFSPAGYRTLLEQLQAAGFALRPVEAMANPAAPVAYLRHDVDLHLRGIDEIARIEAGLGAGATYFVALTQPYNPALAGNRAVLTQLVALGHRIGLHYDLATYPRDHDAARAHLWQEIRSLQQLVEAPVASICMHNPWEAEPDLFAASVPDGLLHPHAPRFASVRYVSDSCRAWRDEALLDYLRDPEAGNLLLGTHPELWLGSAQDDRLTFLHSTLMDAATADARELLLDSVLPSWRRHPAARRHDERERVGGGRE